MVNVIIRPIKRSVVRAKRPRVTIEYHKELKVGNGATLFAIQDEKTGKLHRYWVPHVLMEHEEDYKRFTMDEQIARNKGLYQWRTK